MASLRQFTVEDIAEFGGISPVTVRTVISRNREFIEPIENVPTGRRGNRFVKYAVRSDRVADLESRLDHMTAPFQIESGSPARPRAISAALRAAEETLVHILPTESDPDRRQAALETAETDLWVARGELSDASEIPGSEPAAHLVIVEVMLELSRLETNEGFRSEDEVRRFAELQQKALHALAGIADDRLKADILMRLVQSPLAQTAPAMMSQARSAPKPPVLLVNTGLDGAAGVEGWIEHALNERSVQFDVQGLEEVASGTVAAPPDAVYMLPVAADEGERAAQLVARLGDQLPGEGLLVVSDRQEPNLASSTFENRGMYLATDGLKPDSFLAAVRRIAEWIARIATPARVEEASESRSDQTTTGQVATGYATPNASAPAGVRRGGRSQSRELSPGQRFRLRDESSGEAVSRTTSILGAGSLYDGLAPKLVGALRNVDALSTVLAIGGVNTDPDVELRRASSQSSPGVVDITPTITDPPKSGGSMTGLRRRSHDVDDWSSEIRESVAALVRAHSENEVASGQIVWVAGYATGHDSIARIHLSEIRKALPRELVLAVTTLPAERGATRELARTQLFPELKAESLVDAVILTDNKSPLATASGHRLELQDRYLATALASLLASSEHFETRDAFGEMVRTLGQLGTFASLAFSSHAVAASGDSEPPPAQRTPARGIVDLTSVIRAAFGATEDAVRNPEARAIDDEIDLSMPLFVIYTLPFLRSDSSWMTVSDGIRRWLSDHYPTARPFFAGEQTKRRLDRARVQASVLFPIARTPRVLRGPQVRRRVRLPSLDS
jgi:hypothetical protein